MWRKNTRAEEKKKGAWESDEGPKYKKKDFLPQQK